MKRSVLLSSSFMIASFYISISEAAENHNQLPPTKPLAVVSGADSHITKPSCKRVTSSDEWTQVWVDHLGTTKDDAYHSSFEIDFGRCLAVAVFCGREVNVRGIEINSMSEASDAIVIRFTRLGYQSAGDDNDQLDHPYAFIILPKTNKTIVLEENVQQYKGEAPEWKVYARLRGGVPPENSIR